MMYKIFGSLHCLFVIVALLVGCSARSPLSDEELTDPSLIVMTASFIKGLDQHDRVRVELDDELNRSIEIKGGGVYINSQAMEIDREFFGPDLRYILEDGEVTIVPGADYEIKIVLSDGSTSISRFKFSAFTEEQFTYSDTISRGDSWAISWTPADSGYDLKFWGTHHQCGDTTCYSGMPPAPLSDSNRLIIPSNKIYPYSDITGYYANFYVIGAPSPDPQLHANSLIDARNYFDLKLEFY